MQTLATIASLRAELRSHRQAGRTIAFVPTMGNLHAGHVQLIEKAAESADIVVASIFINPLQFGKNEDLNSYPRTLQEDQRKLIDAGCHYLFAPTESEVYPNGRDSQTRVEVPVLSDLYCGEARPGHFSGVTTVVCKLFNIVQPDIAIFGEKDYQQLRIVRKMVSDLCIATTVLSVPIVRDASGLALSSRNGYLSPAELEQAPALRQVITHTASEILSGRRDYTQLEQEAILALEAKGFKRDYFRIVRQSDLAPATQQDKELVILAAAWMGPARLIDNQELDL